MNQPRDYHDPRFGHGLLLLVAVLPYTLTRFRLRFAWLLICAAVGVLVRARYASMHDLEVRVIVKDDVAS